jgi:hypothetical protein
VLVTDLRHFDGIELDLDAPAPARRLYEHLASIVRAATALPSTGRRTAVRCRRRPGRTPCTGRIVIGLSDDSPTVHWVCPSCRDEGIISGWQGTPADLSPDSADEGRRTAAAISEEAYEALRSCVFLDRSVERVVHTAEPVVHGDVRLCATDEEWEDVRDAVAAEANHASRSRQRRLDDVLRQLEAALRPSARGRRHAPGASVAQDIPELTRLAAARDVAAYCEQRVPLPARHQVRLEFEVKAASLTIVERRVPFDASGPVDHAAWTRLPVAQLRYGGDHLWRVHWRDAEERWHLDRGARPSSSLDPLLRHIDADTDAVYWG